MIEDEERKRERYHPLHHPVLGRLCLRSAISQSGAPPWLTGALYLQLLLMMRLNCRERQKVRGQKHVPKVSRV